MKKKEALIIACVTSVAVGVLFGMLMGKENKEVLREAVQGIRDKIGNKIPAQDSEL